MRARWWKRESRLESLLRSSRPEPPESLVERLVARASTPRTQRRGAPRLALAGGFSVIVLVALGSVGGISYAASVANTIVRHVVSHDVYMGKQMAVAVDRTSAATDQYGNPTNSANVHTATVTKGTSGGIGVQTVPPPGQTGKPIAVTASWSGNTFGGQPVVVNVDPTPPSVTSSALIGGDNQLVAINVHDTNGQPVHTLSAPLDIVFSNPPKGFVPTISENGTTFKALKKVPGPGLPPGATDGYYVDASGNIHILTLHLTIFAVLYRGNVTVSATGRPLAKAGSGLFGDPTRITEGPAVLKEIATKAKPRRLKGSLGELVPFTFFVNEQASIHLSIFKGNSKVPIAMRDSVVRGNRVAKNGTVKNFHVVILRPGTIKMALRVPGAHLVKGQKYRIRVWALDYDLNKTVKYIPFTAS